MAKKKNKGKIEFVKDFLVEDMVEYLVKFKGVTKEEALRFFLTTQTYKYLKNDNMYLYLESKEYIWDMLQSEMRGEKLHHETGLSG